MSGVLVSYQEYVGTVSTDDPDAHRLMLRLRTLPADVNWTQVDDAFAGRREKKIETHLNWGKTCVSCVFSHMIYHLSGSDNNFLLKPYMISENEHLPPSSGRTSEQLLFTKSNNDKNPFHFQYIFNTLRKCVKNKFNKAAYIIKIQSC